MSYPPYPEEYRKMARREVHVAIAAFLAFILFVLPGVCLGQDEALEQLINMFEKKGLLSPSEAGLVRETLAKETEKLQKKEKALLIKEEELKAKEEALQEKAAASSKQGKTETAEIAPQKEEKLEVSYDNGLCLSTQAPYEFSLCFGGLLQADYQYFDYGDEDASKDRFDIRRARLILQGKVLKYFDYKFQYEFQGAESRNLLDAYADVNALKAASFRIGQFKEPFGLEQSTDIKNWVFTEASSVYYLSPHRDVGLMAHASLWNDRVNYGIGIFNGDGPDDSVGGDVDSPQVTARVVFSPFKTMNIPALENLQFGGSFSHADIDRNNVSINIKTPGLTTFFSVASAAKYRIIRDADSCDRYDVELGWAYGPVALMAEYARVYYDNVRTSAEQFDIDLDARYVSFLWMITGEKPSFRQGVLQSIEPEHGVFQGGWGALGLALRYSAFQTDEGVYQYLVTQGDSVRKADSYSIALNWWLNRFVRLIIDYSRTDFDSPLLIARDPLTGTAVYSDHENIITGRFQFQF
jgi:phosphate-selective porin OprO/OprP